MAERSNTGGTKSFSYSKEDSERIRTEGTESTESFKEALMDWKEEREVMRAQRRALIDRLKKAVGFSLGLLAVLVLVWYFF